jgi:hypothetical protein
MRRVSHEEILTRLGIPEGRNYRCPAHGDRNPSMTVSLSSDETTLFYCHTGCSFEDICSALGIEPSDCFPDTEIRERKPWEQYEYF